METVSEKNVKIGDYCDTFEERWEDDVVFYFSYGYCKYFRMFIVTV